MKKDREICSEWISLGKPQRTQRETMFTENEYPHKDIYSLVRYSDLTVLFAVDAKASGVSSRRNLNDLRVGLNKPSGEKHPPEGLKIELKTNRLQKNHEVEKRRKVK